MAETSNVVPLRGRKGAAPIPLNGKVPPPRRKNKDVRSREHLTPDEVERLIASAKSLGRYGHRDATLILMDYRHGLRVSELVALRWDMVDLKKGLLHVSRLKNGVASTHPIRGPEIRALRRLKRDYPTPRTCLSLSVRGRSQRQQSARSYRGPVSTPRLDSPFIPTCSDTVQATSWLMMATIRGRSNTTLATRIFSTLSATRNCQPTGSKTSGPTRG